MTRRAPAAPRRVEFHYLKDATGRYAPIVYLQVRAENRWLYLQAYVDSGASWTIFHTDVAQILGIQLTRARRHTMILGNGSVIPIVIRRLRVRFAGREFTVPAAFSDALKIGFNVLGREGFFDRFVVCFHDRARRLIVTPIQRPGS